MKQKVCPRCGLICEREQYICPCCFFNFANFVMELVYFDTSVYNKILDHSKLSLITKALDMAGTSGKFEILFSLNNFEEFCHTRGIDRRARLFKLAFSICKHRFVLSHEELLKKDAEAYLNNSSLAKDDIYDKIDFEDTFSKAINGKLFQGVSDRPFKELKKKKQEFLRFEKNMKKRLTPLWEVSKYISFDEFYENSLRNKEAKELLRDIFIRAVEDNRRRKQDFPELDLQRLPGLRCIFKYMCASIYKQLLKGEKPKWGSGIDMNHSVFLGYCDIFVTADTNFLDILHLFKEPETQCLSFIEFMLQCVGADI